MMKDKLEKQWGKMATDCYYDNHRDANLCVYKNIAILNSQGIFLGDILNKIGVNKASIYGFGVVGKIVYEEIKTRLAVKCIYDNGKAGETTDEGILIRSGEEVNIDCDEVIIITPGKLYWEIFCDLLNKGIDKKKILSVDEITHIGLNWEKIDSNYFANLHFLITGAQFANKGAQAMLFVTMSEIRKKNPGAVIWYQACDNYNSYEGVTDRYNFILLSSGEDIYSDAFFVANRLDAIVDISGYALSSNWKCDWYLLNMRIAKVMNIPLFLMPQSYGPFEFEKDLDENVRELLAYAKIVYAREGVTARELREKYKLNNIIESNDLVLQNKNVCIENIFTKAWVVPSREWDIKENSIAIIPNVRLIEFSDIKKVNELYDAIIEYTMKAGKNIYIIKHSNDSELCKLILERHKNEGIIYIDEEVDCFEFQKMISKFDYVIASRYHAAVHSYKSGTPVIAIGWAEKYAMLLNVMGQSKYCCNDIQNINISNVIEIIGNMNNNFVKERMIINDRLIDIQKQNCFDSISL